MINLFSAPKANSCLHKYQKVITELLQKKNEIFDNAQKEAGYKFKTLNFFHFSASRKRAGFICGLGDSTFTNTACLSTTPWTCLGTKSI